MELVHGALKFDDTVRRSVMTPRTKMFTLNSKILLFEALPQINQSEHSSNLSRWRINYGG